MACPACGGEATVAAVPDPLSQHVPEDADRITICSACLSIFPTTDTAPDSTAFTDSTTAFPADADAAVGVVVLVHLLDSLAHNRAAIESVVGWLETRGVDVFLVLGRLAAEPSLSPHVDLERRLPQLEQIVG